MREILFRGKTISGEWVEGSLLKEAHNHYIVPEYDQTRSAMELHYVIPSTIGQFTGLHDRDGNRIFEGDRIEEGEVYFDAMYLGFFVKVEYVEEMTKALYDIPLPKIIGNIHES